MNQRLKNSAKVLLSVREEEKLRISQEIHDTIGQSLVVLKMRVQQYMQEKTLQENGPYVLDWINQAINQSHALINDLRMDLVAHNGLMKAINDYAEAVKKYSAVKIRTSLPDDSYSYNQHDSLQLFRIVQESVTNAVKHSKASDIAVEVVRKQQQDIFTIRDNGVGFDPEKMNGKNEPGHFGLHIIRERCKAIGAGLEINSSLDLGTQVTIRYKHKKQEDL